jgi:Tfp pilus assembly protein PilF
VSDQLQKAIALIKSGDKQNGKQLLAEILKTESQNEAAWLWMSSVMDKDEEQRYCLERALAINPDSVIARRGLARLARRQK